MRPGDSIAEAGRGAAGFGAGNGRDFEESQYLLRIKGKGPFRAFVVPWRKGRAPADVRVIPAGADVTVRSGGAAVRFRADGSFSR